MRIACVLANGFEDSEFKEPGDAFRAAGHEVTIVGLEAGAQVEGSKGKVKATVEKSFKDVGPDDFDALFIPGGFSPDRLRALEGLRPRDEYLHAHLRDSGCHPGVPRRGDPRGGGGLGGAGPAHARRPAHDADVGPDHTSIYV